MNVLIVDDESLKIAEIKKAVEENLLGCSIDTFSYVVDAIEGFQNKKYDLVISDMHYKVRPGENINTDAGLIFIRKIRKKSSVPIIICSSEHRDIPDNFQNVSMVTFSTNSISKKLENEFKRMGFI